MFIVRNRLVLCVVSNRNMEFVVTLLVALASLAISADAGASMHDPFFCYATDPIRSSTITMGPASSYEAIRRFNFTTFNPNVSTCTPSRIWYLGRYGSRLPLLVTIQRMIEFAESSIQDDIISNYESGRTTLCRQDYELIRNYPMLESYFGSMLRTENAEMETESGIFAVQNISRRYQNFLPHILTETYTPSRFHFRHTSSQRTNDSIRAFATGLFGEAGVANVLYEPVPEFDWLLRPLEFCPAYSEETSDWTRHRLAFAAGPEMQEMIQQINRKLGFHGSRQMNFDQIYTMWNWCRFEVAVTFEISGSETGENTPLCVPFSVAHHRLMEYFEDLTYFYLNGYGIRNQRLLQNLNCGRIQDLLHHMQSDNDADTIARVFFTHVYEIVAMLAGLGTFRDVWPLHQHNFAQQTNRHWVISLMSPFSSNLAVVRFDCDDGDHDLVFLLNERPLLIPGCDQENAVCKLSVIVDRFQRFIDADCSTFFCSSD